MKSKIKIYLKLLSIRWQAAYQIFFGKRKHWFVVALSEDELINVFEGKETEVFITSHKLQEFNVNQIIRCMNRNINKDEYILQKAAFKAEVELRNNIDISAN